MRWRNETRAERKAAQCSWHRWWAWFPVKTDGQTAWLETVERRAIEALYDPMAPVYEYRLDGHPLQVKSR